jgi:pyruvate ferredoxin oxidoreductase beta subunit
MAVLGLPEEELFAPGHRACAGCGAAVAFRFITKATGKDVIICQATGCGEVFSTPYPQTAWRIPWMHSLFENAACIANGVWAALKSQGLDDKIKVVALGGDGATFDIGFGHLSGMFERGTPVCYICYDNEAYMNTGIQRSGATPYGASTTTSPAGKKSIGKVQFKKDLVHILAAHNSTYLATASIAWPNDLYNKLKKALSIKAPTFIHIHATCPTGWYSDPANTVDIAKLAVDTGIFPLFEIEDGRHKLTRELEPRKPIKEYLKLQKRFAHLTEKDIGVIQKHVDERCTRLQKMVDSGL